MRRETFTIATLNTFGAQAPTRTFFYTYKKIGEIFNSSAVTVLHVQEVLTYFHLALLKRYILHTFPYCTYYPSFVGPRGGLVTFSRVPLELVDFPIFSNRGYIFDISAIDIFLLKGILIAKIPHAPIYIMNTHFTANFLYDWKVQNKYTRIIGSQIGEFHRYLNNYAFDDSVIIAAGDFNIAKNSRMYRHLINFPNLADVFSTDNTPTFHAEYLPQNIVPFRIDYIFVIGKRDRYVIEAKTHIAREKQTVGNGESVYISDHIGLQLSIHLRDEMFGKSIL